MLDPMAITDQSFLAFCALSLLCFSLFVCLFVSGFRSLLCLFFPPCPVLHCTAPASWPRCYTTRSITLFCSY
jgi:hypothetical protein